MEDQGEDQLAPDALAQLSGASRGLLVEDRVGENPAGLSRENLGRTDSEEKVTCNLLVG